MRLALYHNLPSGGAKRTLTEATKRLAVNHHVDVYSLTTANHDFADLRHYVAGHRLFDFRAWRLLPSPFGRLNQVSRLADLLRLRAMSRAIARTIEQGNYDVVLAHPCQLAKSPTILEFLEQTPSVYYCHEPLRILYEAMPPRPYDDNAISRRQMLNRVDPLPRLYYRVLKSSDQRNTRRAGTVLVNSKFMREAVNRIYGVHSRVSYHGIDTDRFRPLALEKQPMLLSVGSLTPLKGFDFLIQAVAQLPAAGRPALVIASNFQNPPEQAYLEQLAAELQVELRLVGNVSDDDLVRLYNQAQLVLYAPIREPFGLVPLEAMACGAPVVAVREGGIQETVINGQTGLLTEREPGQFAEAIQTLLVNPALAAEVGRNGQEYVRHQWSWSRAAATLENHLLEATRLAYSAPALVASSIH